MADSGLNESERDLLLWLAREDYSQYGECYGSALTSLMMRGLAQVHGPGERQHFIANDHAGTKGMMYRAVSLTEEGFALARRLRETPV